MEFYCKNCDVEFHVDDKECEGYYNWKCPDCLHIAMKKDAGFGGIIWKCDTGTAKRTVTSRAKKKTEAPACATAGASSACGGCPSAG